nr:zinc finger, CCHC-type, retrotransposon Gag domain protein [Tanacetum cinerariifolium]
SPGLQRFFCYAMFIYSFYLCYVLSLYPFTKRYAQPYIFSCLIRQTFKTLCLLDYALMIRHDYDLTSSLRKGALQLWYQNQFFPRAEHERLKREYHSIRQTNTETSTEFMQRFLRLVGFLGAAAGTEEEQAKNFQWGLHRSTLNHLMCMPFTDVAQVANAARNYEILHERDDDDAERLDKRQRSGDRHQSTSQQSSHRSHGHHND